MFFNLDLPTLISRIVTLLLAFTFHEFAHAATASALGDETPRRFGRLTLNPLAHLDPMGTLTLVVAGFGWAKPVPVSEYAVNRKTKAGMMMVALAGPVTNLLLGALAALPLRFNWISWTSNNSNFLPSWSSFLLEFLSINLALFLFNLIPLAPLDGEKVISYFLPQRWADFYDRIRPYSPVILLILIFLLPMLGVDVIGIIIRQPMMDIANFLLGWS